MQPQIIMPAFKGKHNEDFGATTKRLQKSRGFEDLSTVIICPTRGMIPAKVVSSWLGLFRPLNERVLGPFFGVGMTVDESYKQLVEAILAHPDLGTYKYILTVEEDNTPPPDGLLMLYESIEGKVNGTKYDVVGGLYFTKGEG